MKTTESKNNEMDVNDVFESILLSEERVSEEGYRKGFEIGVRDGNLEAYHCKKIFIMCSHNFCNMNFIVLQWDFIAVQKLELNLVSILVF